MRKLIIYILISVTLFSVVGCSKWLNVRVSTDVTEKDLFSEYSGFNDALMDCYTSMASGGCYGANLSYQMIDYLANIWNEPDAVRNLAMSNVYKHNYEEDDVVQRLDNTFQQLYLIILKANIIIHNAELHPKVFPTTQERDIILGEALAIRAFCQFDILRLWGQQPNNPTKNVSLPYSEVYNLAKRPAVLGFDDYVSKLKGDLDLARTLLAKSDPVSEYTYNELNNAGNPGFEQVKLIDKYAGFRQLRLNYWAVRGLQARLELYLGNKTEAYKIAKEVIDAKTSSGKKVVSLSTAADFEKRYYASPSEGLFLLSVPNLIKSTLPALGGADKPTDPNIVSTISAQVLSNVIFENKNLNDDLRYTRLWLKNTPPVGSGETFPTIRKYFYEKKETDNITIELQTKQEVIPLIRLSEMYLIAMESTSDLNEANELYKEFMLARNVNVVNRTFLSLEQVKPFIIREYLREFYAEGQIFYMYKRLGIDKFPLGMKGFKKELYILPFSDDKI